MTPTEQSAHQSTAEHAGAADAPALLSDAIPTGPGHQRAHLLTPGVIAWPADLVDDADLILVMDEANLADARRLATTDEQRDRIHLMGEFASDADSAGVREVPDPYGYPRPQFEEMYRQIEDAADGVVAAIRDGRL